MFNIVASGFMDARMFEQLSSLAPDAAAILEGCGRGVSMVTAPSGASIAGELCADEGILYADIDVGDCVEPKQFHDVSAGYNRFDVFHLTVDRTARRPVRFLNDEAALGLEQASDGDEDDPISRD